MQNLPFQRERDLEPVEIPRGGRELWKDGRLDDLVVPVVKNCLAIFLRPDGIVSVMKQRMMPIAQHHKVVSIGRTAINPVSDMMGSQKFRIAATGEAAALAGRPYLCVSSPSAAAAVRFSACAQVSGESPGHPG